MPKQNPGTNQELLDIEKKIASLVARRSTLLSKISQQRQDKNKSFADPDLEKKLWQAWKKEFSSSNPSLMRQIFNLLNSLGYLQAERSLSDKPFSLYPSRKVLDLDFKGPLDQNLMHALAVMGVLSPGDIHLEGFTLNDQLLELTKIANECGAGLSWREHALTGRGLSSPNMDGHSLFIGNSRFNLYFFFCLGLASPSRIRFSGSALLKTLNLQDLQRLAPTLGARFSSIEPQSYTLPAKLESSGTLPTEIRLPENMDTEFVRALVLASSVYPDPVSIFYPSRSDSDVRDCAQILSHFGIQADPEEQEHKITIHPGSPVCKEQPQIPLDPLLSGFLLALAKPGKGRVKLAGCWPGQSELACEIELLLRGCALDLEISPDGISSQDSDSPMQTSFNLTRHPELAPLIVPLAITGQQEDTPLTFMLPQESLQLEAAADLLSLLGFDFSYISQGLRVKGPGKIPDKELSWTSPDPYWTLGCSIISFKYPGICLSNPGNLSSLWPEFWKIFTNLSPKKVHEKDEQPPQPRKRIRIRKD